MRIALLVAVTLMPGFGLLGVDESKPSKTTQPTSVQGDPVELGIPKQEKVGQLPAMTTALSERATQAFGKKDWVTARKCYLEMLQEDPQNALILANIGTVEQQDGKLKEAQNYFARALMINPGLQQTWTALGLVSYELGDAYYAVSALTRAVHEDPTDARAHNYLAAAAKKLGWLDAAEAELRRAIELYPDYANAHFNLAVMYMDRKPPAIELARRHYETALSLGSGRDELIDEKLKQR